jgi:hypothetical protein
MGLVCRSQKPCLTSLCIFAETCRQYLSASPNQPRDTSPSHSKDRREIWRHTDNALNEPVATYSTREWLGVGRPWEPMQPVKAILSLTGVDFQWSRETQGVDQDMRPVSGQSPLFGLLRMVRLSLKNFLRWFLLMRKREGAGECSRGTVLGISRRRMVTIYRIFLPWSISAKALNTLNLMRHMKVPRQRSRPGMERWYLRGRL